MTTIQHYATNYIENAKVTLTTSSQIIEAKSVEYYVEYYIASGYVKVITQDDKTLITHISNVVIEVT
ncbi:hypothetical protein [Leptolyngbya sp. O-77]|uniref:hypothetical protein n=1 Tax=Leptolyngbya sp. O-77 TaxID=1080068 RepID=UPI00074D2CC7|nr:hypothetical protein [Leptolyngbya sp. O-77]BAU40289.1 hypothetical protein O77CONTIG1_00086 [Leptolyngbya sp. O-77]